MVHRVRRYGLYALLALTVSAAAYCAIVVVANASLLLYAFKSSTIPLFLNILISPQAFLSETSLLVMLLTIMLLGINVALMTYQVRRGALGGAQGLIGTIAGGIAGLLGIGCAACGALFLSGLLAVGGVVGFLAYLPLHGAEFAWGGLVCMAIGTFVLIREARRPLVC